MNTNTDTVTEKSAPMSAEQAADFAALQAGVAGAQPVPGTEPPAQEQGPDLAQELAGLVTVAVATLSPLFPSLRDTYTPEVTQAAAGAIAAVCNKHGWMQGGLMGEWGEEIACAAIVGPLAFSTWQGIRADLDARAAVAKKAQSMLAPSAPSEGAKTVTIGTVQA